MMRPPLYCACTGWKEDRSIQIVIQQGILSGHRKSDALFVKMHIFVLQNDKKSVIIIRCR